MSPCSKTSYCWKCLFTHPHHLDRIRKLGHPRHQSAHHSPTVAVVDSPTMTSQIHVTYAVHPPADVTPAVPAPSTETRTLAAQLADRPSAREYYASASAALREAQVWLNDSLTVWKDAVGDKEKSKEDRGKVARGQGRAAVMSREAKAGIMAGSGIGSDARDEEEEDEDEP